MNYEKIRSLKRFYINNKKREDINTLFIEKFNDLEQWEQYMIVGTLVNTEYDYEQDEELDKKKNELILKFLRQPELLKIHKILLEFIKDPTDDRHKKYWTYLAIIENDGDYIIRNIVCGELKIDF